MPLVDNLIIKGAREHNLKNLNIEIPRDKLIVITGVSGSGKSSLAFDTIYAEGQRRYVESLSAYARQFLEQMKKPEVDLIDGLSPAISIDQFSISPNPRSTVGTITEIYDFLRLLYTRVGHPFCYQCGAEILPQTPQRMMTRILNQHDQNKLILLSPVIRGRKGSYQKELVQFRNRGFARVYINGKPVDLSEDIKLDRNKKHNIDLEIDRVIVKTGIKDRLLESIGLALRESKGLLKILDVENQKTSFFSEKAACPNCGISYPEIEPRLFSFNSPYGACPKCNGLGVEGLKEEDILKVNEDNNEFENIKICTGCNGTRLRKESLFIKIHGNNLNELGSLPVDSLLNVFSSWKFTSHEADISKPILKEVLQRLRFLKNVGLGYLSLNREARTLSGGEGQRIRLATQIGSSLTGVLYVLDEPSIGLHQKDIHKLLDTLKTLRDGGNTLIVVEHDEYTIRSSDFMIDMGPGAGIHGGEILASGSPAEVMKNRKSLTGSYLSGRVKIPIPVSRKVNYSSAINIKNARLHNLKNINVTLPVGFFICVTGVSGSGKSSLILDTLFDNLKRLLNKNELDSKSIDALEGIDKIESVIKIDHSPIGRTPRSNPATYSGIFSNIRDIFSQVPEARLRGYKPSRFSFNLSGGRCEACKGDGAIRIEMHFLPSVYVQCEVCKGARYSRETLEILFKGKSISDVLNLTIDEAYEVFQNVPKVKVKLQMLKDVGLGYIHLGQSAPTLSGGEAQRLKLARELSKRSAGKSLYILDEPTTGLHFADIGMLLKILFRLRDDGNTIIVIEHNLDVIKSADHIIDMGPEGGDAGGYIVAVGTPEEVAKNKDSHTGKFLFNHSFGQ